MKNKRITRCCGLAPIALCLLSVTQAVCSLPAQQWQAIDIPVKASLRGVSAGEGGQLYVCGTVPQSATQSSVGVVFFSPDEGRTWFDRSPREAGAVDFRSLAIIDQSTLVVASAGSPALILRSADQGQSWERVYQNEHSGAFINSVHFWDSQRGLACGDPIEGRFLILRTEDGGRTWQTLDCPIIAREGEAGFAASNGLIVAIGERSAVIGLGGGVAVEPANEVDQQASRVLRTDDFGATWMTSEVGVMPAGPSAGIFGLATGPSGLLVAVGGDYKLPAQPLNQIAISADAGATWRLPTGNKPPGFRSSIVFVPPSPAAAAQIPDLQRSGSKPAGTLNSGYWLATGPNGTDISLTGDDWYPLASLGFNAISNPAPLRHGKAWPVLVGSEGRVSGLLPPAKLSQ
ncbi:hypothetical protein SH139x_004112 [Planctomycetaceae bacterium SH139]